MRADALRTAAVAVKVADGGRVRARHFQESRRKVFSQRLQLALKARKLVLMAANVGGANALRVRDTLAQLVKPCRLLLRVGLLVELKTRVAERAQWGAFALRSL